MAREIHDDDVRRCLAIGAHGAELFGSGAPHPDPLQRRRPGDGRVRHGARRHPLPRTRAAVIGEVLVDETRPWLQGAV